MDVYKPFRVVLFIYEVLRLLFLAFAFTYLSSLRDVMEEGFFPFIAYMSSNALFPLICFFLCLRLGEYRNYLPLYMAGKTIAVVLYSVWFVFSFSQEIRSVGMGSNLEYFTEWMMLLGGAFFFNFGDMLSILGAWVLNNKLSQMDSRNIEIGEIGGGI